MEQKEQPVSKKEPRRRQRGFLFHHPTPSQSAKAINVTTITQASRATAPFTLELTPLSRTRDGLGKDVLPG
jgi:hypothetical protein